MQLIPTLHSLRTSRFVKQIEDKPIFLLEYLKHCRIRFDAGAEVVAMPCAITFDPSPGAVSIQPSQHFSKRQTASKGICQVSSDGVWFPRLRVEIRTILNLARLQEKPIYASASANQLSA
jgi:hypothetical protein